MLVVVVCGGGEGGYCYPFDNQKEYKFAKIFQNDIWCQISTSDTVRPTARLRKLKPPKLLTSSVTHYTESYFIIRNYLKLVIVSTDGILSSKLVRFIARVQFFKNEKFYKYVQQTQLYFIYSFNIILCKCYKIQKKLNYGYMYVALFYLL